MEQIKKELEYWLSKRDAEEKKASGKLTAIITYSALVVAPILFLVMSMVSFCQRAIFIGILEFLAFAILGAAAVVSTISEVSGVVSDMGADMIAKYSSDLLAELESEKAEKSLESVKITVDKAKQQFEPVFGNSQESADSAFA